MSPLLSIVTITKDDPAGLACTLNSTVSWRARAWVEHIVVYAGEAPAGSDSSIRLEGQVSTGIGNAFNEGLRLAQGEWVWFLNGGDRAHDGLDPEWLRGLLGATSAEIVTGAVQRDDASVPQVPPVPELQWPLTACWLAHPSTLVRRGAIEKAGGFDPRWRIAMDYELWHRLFASGARVDVVAMPFARFDVKGVSERADTHQKARLEDARLTLLQAWPMTKACLRSFRRLVVRLARAVMVVLSRRATGSR